VTLTDEHCLAALAQPLPDADLLTQTMVELKWSMTLGCRKNSTGQVYRPLVHNS